MNELRSSSLRHFAVLALVLLTGGPVWATFPGLNGPIVFQTNRDGLLGVARVVPGEPHQGLGLAGGGYRVDMNYAPDGQRVVYTVYDTQNTSISTLRVADVVAGGGDVPTIPSVPISGTLPNGNPFTVHYYPRHPSFSADGNSVVFSQAGHIRRYDLATDAIVELTSASSPPTALGTYYWPVESPDGATVAMQLLGDDGYRAIGLMAAGGGALSAIGEGLVIPTWHPTLPQLLAVDVDFGGNQRHFVALSMNGARANVFTAPGSSVGGDTDLGRFRVVWSPDATMIAYTALNGDVGNSLYTVTVATSQVELIATEPSQLGNAWHAIRPTWGSNPGVDLEPAISSSHERFGDDWTVTYDVTVTNRGVATATSVPVFVSLPDYVRLVSIETPGPDCVTTPANGGRAGGFSNCLLPAIAGGASTTIRFVTDVTNASDLPAQRFQAEVNRNRPVLEYEYGNNLAEERVTLPLDAGTPQQVRDWIAAGLTSGDLAGFFITSLWASGNSEFGAACTGWQAEVLQKLEDLRTEKPDLFLDMSYGPVTDGGHNGVVIYPSGTNYHASGVVVHGTAAPSQYGGGPTWLTRVLWVTDVQNWQRGLGQSIFGPITPTLQNDQSHGRFFETPSPGGMVAPDNFPAGTCPFVPDAVGISTSSPIELRITNSLGQRVNTLRDGFAVNELETPFLAYQFFDDETQTTDWDLVLPPDRYEVEIVGTKVGPYTLTLTTFDASGDPVQTAYAGETQSGKRESFVVALTACPAAPVDTDEDGVCNGVDNCPLMPNPGQADGDDDGFGDTCDPCTGSDIDADGVCDGVDNCPTVENPFQEDDDEDGVGDACDPCPFDTVNDPDEDGICATIANCEPPVACDPSFEECCDPFTEPDCCTTELCAVAPCYDNCPFVANPSQQDSDNDGAGNECDPCPFDYFDTCEPTTTTTVVTTTSITSSTAPTTTIVTSTSTTSTTTSTVATTSTTSSTVAPSTTTSSTVATTSTTSSTVPTTTSVTSTSTTSTTLPPGCTEEATYASVLCRLDAMTQVIAGADTGVPRESVLPTLSKARDAVAAALAASEAGEAKPTAKALKRAVKALSSFARRLGGKKANTIGKEIAAEAAGLRDHVKALR